MRLLSVTVATLLPLPLLSLAGAVLIPRQTPDNLDPRIPSGCSTDCVPSFPIYDACLYDRPGCETVCWPDNRAAFVRCQQCLLNSSDHVIKGQVDSGNNVIKQLAADCAKNGTAVSAATISAVTAQISTAPRPSATEFPAQNNNFAAGQPLASSGAASVVPIPGAPSWLGLGALVLAGGWAM